MNNQVGDVSQEMFQTQIKTNTFKNTLFAVDYSKRYFYEGASSNKYTRFGNIFDA